MNLPLHYGGNDIGGVSAWFGGHLPAVEALVVLLCTGGTQSFGTAKVFPFFSVLSCQKPNSMPFSQMLIHGYGDEKNQTSGKFCDSNVRTLK